MQMRRQNDDESLFCYALFCCDEPSFTTRFGHIDRTQAWKLPICLGVKPHLSTDLASGSRSGDILSRGTRRHDAILPAAVRHSWILTRTTAHAESTDNSCELRYAGFVAAIVWSRDYLELDELRETADRTKANAYAKWQSPHSNCANSLYHQRVTPTRLPIDSYPPRSDSPLRDWWSQPC